jgi:cytochrome P450
MDSLVLRARFGAQAAAMWALARSGDLLCQMLRREHIRDPYGVYDRMRAHGPVYRSRTGYSAIVSHTLCSQVLRDPRFGVRTASGKYLGEGDPSRAAVWDLGGSMLLQDPPVHGGMRQAVAPSFRAKLMRHHRERIEKIASQLLDGVYAQPDFDLHADFARPLPLLVIADLLGVPIDVNGHARPGSPVYRLGTFGGEYASAIDGIQSARQMRDFVAAQSGLRTVMRELIEQRRNTLADAAEYDVIARLIRAEQSGEISTEAIVANCMTLFLGAYQTTSNLITFAVNLLLEAPEQWVMLRENPGLVPQAVEEVLRYEPPVHMTLRTNREDAEIGGQHFPKETESIIMIGAANRDPEVYANPGRFDITRTGEPEHLAFSHGIHYCMGAGLARLEGEVALQLLLERMPSLAPSGAPQWKTRTFLRSIERLPVASEPAGLARCPVITGAGRPSGPASSATVTKVK